MKLRSKYDLEDVVDWVGISGAYQQDFSDGKFKLDGYKFWGGRISVERPK